MKRLILLSLLLIPLISFAQDNIILSKENANEKGISVIWPGCDKNSRLSPAKCFDNNMRKHIIKTFRYPKEALSEKLSGTVTVEFIINTKGKVEIIEVTGAHRYLQREAIRIIRALPKMKPGKWGKKPIGIVYTVPIAFGAPVGG